MSETTIRLLEPADRPLLDRVAEDVFDAPIDPRWTEEFLSDPRHHMAVALVDDEIVAMASAVHYVHPDKGPELWINEVGVAGHHQGKGLARQLLRALFERGRELGCHEAWVLTERNNARARRLYQAVGGEEETVVYATFPLADDSD